jgi:hypothetical protein
MKKLDFKQQLLKMIKDFDNYKEHNFGRQLATLTEGSLQTQTYIEQEDGTTNFIAIIKDPKYIPTCLQVNACLDWGNHCLSPKDVANIAHTQENFLIIIWNNAGHI